MTKTRWYKDAVFYQIYPRSFYDTNADGIGDLRGIIEKLDYLKDLGINAVWLSPIFCSPNHDNGYDISDYKAIHPEFGTMEDFDEMLAGMHARGIRLVMDLVVNHTSDEHPWFLESKDPRSPYRDYYIWRKGQGKDGKKPPNNWTSRFTGKAWTYDEDSGEWYLHLFGTHQPDLNWDNPRVREEVADISNFWLQKGVDGFRCDVITYISKVEGLPDGKRHPVLVGDEHFVLGPHIHEYLNEINQKSWANYDTMVVGECIGVTHDRVENLVKEDRNELDSAITFELMEVDMMLNFLPRKLKLKKFKQVQSAWQAMPKDCWNTLYYENHDQPRSISRYGNANGIYRKELAKMLAISLHFLRGTPYIYQGQEIGMSNFQLAPNEHVDIVSVEALRIIKKFFPFLTSLALKILAKRGREQGRTPMQWNKKRFAGFTTGEKPWLKVNPNHSSVNVEADLKNPNSILNFYKKLIEIRKGDKIIRDGEYTEFCQNDRNVFCYERKLNKRRYIVLCNFKEKRVNVNAIDLKARGAKLFLSNYPSSQETFTDGMTLNPYEALVYYQEDTSGGGGV